MQSKNVPNHTQAARIRFDIQHLLELDIDCKDMKPFSDSTIWFGNSYRAELERSASGSNLTYSLVHWRTTIAELKFDVLDPSLRARSAHQQPVTLSRAYFDAARFSNTTGRFQSRILSGFSGFPVLAEIVALASAEFAKRDPRDRKAVLVTSYGLVQHLTSGWAA